MPVLNPVPIPLVIENPADNLADMNIVVDISLDCHRSRPASANILPASLHLLKTLLPESHVIRTQIDPALLCPRVHILVCDLHVRLNTFWYADARAANDLPAIRQKNRQSERIDRLAQLIKLL